jgi:hypothetical protein
VSEVVPADIWQTGTFQQGLKVSVYDVLRFEQRTLRGSEHKPVILPVSASPKLFL